ncbi:hypothetical protein GGF42_005171 [Coemansia sp. RSA 2424]|nr:hypothetical protein GGF42_005171 [Coemansia sp. RSA 2424]
MHSLRSIIIEASAHVTRSAGYDFSAIGNAVHMPKLVDIHVVGQFMSERSARLQNTAALALARGLATMSGVTLRGLTLNKNRPNFVSHTVVVPLWVNASPTRGLHSRGMAVTVLRFSDVDAVEGGAELVRAVRDTLLHLTFMRCSYNQLATLLYSVDGEPLQYPNLCAIHGVLSRGGESRVFNVPKGAFPKLEYLHEAVGYAWQSRMGVVSHLLFNKLSEIELPRLRAIRLRTSRLMTLNHAHLPALEHVSYYTRSELPERLEGPEVCSQLIDLLRHPTLTYLQYYDQLPAVGLLSRLDVKCCNLRYLDVGLITISYENVECILAALSHLCSLTLSISDRWSAIQRKDSRIQLTPLSASVQLLGMYVAAGDPDLQHDSSAVTPSRMIMSRLPMLRKLCLQDSVDSARRFLNLMKQEQRFAWSQNVADNVNVVCMDLFGRAI